MSESKFTPGPWRWDHNDLVSDAPGLNYGSRYVIELHEGAVYSEYSADGSTIDVTLPNAALIAAAPELYEALQSIMLSADNLLRLVDELRERGEVDHWQSIQCADLAADVNIARAALAKAVPQ